MPLLNRFPRLPPGDAAVIEIVENEGENGFMYQKRIPIVELFREPERFADQQITVKLCYQVHYYSVIPFG